MPMSAGRILALATIFGALAAPAAAGVVRGRIQAAPLRAVAPAPNPRGR
jgi:hypothetical protein